MQHIEVGREREMIPGAWVSALLKEKSVGAMDAAVLTKKHLTTIYGWQRKGVEYLDWCGLLALLGEKPDWKPTAEKK